MKKDHLSHDFALESRQDLIDALMRVETLLGPHTLDRYRTVCFAFADKETAMSVGQLRLVLQVEDYLDWVLRKDTQRLLLWRAEARRNDALDVSKQIADLWQALGFCLGRYALGAKDWLKTPEQESGLLPLTIAVALHCYVNELRWRARAELASDVPLKALHRLYAIAETRNIADQEVYPYEADVDFSITPKGQYVLILLMADLAQRDLQPVQQLVAQHWLSTWASDVVLDLTPVAGKHSLQVKLDSSDGIERIVPDGGPTVRYLDIRAVARRIEETDAYLANSDQEDETTRELNEATEADFADTLAWLEKLYQDRSVGFQAARVRQVAPPDRFAQVIIGWSHIQEFLEASKWGIKANRGTFPTTYPSTRSLGIIGEALARSGTASPIYDPQAQTNTEHCNSENFLLWRIRDQSAGGFGLASSHRADAELPVGTLILVAVEGEVVWSLGRVVRKFKGLDETDTRFGIQVIGEDAVPVRLIPRQPDENVGNGQVSTVTGLFLSRPEHHELQELLLVSSSALAYTRRFELRAGSKRLAIRTTLPVQSAGAWVMIQFEEDL